MDFGMSSAIGIALDKLTRGIALYPSLWSVT
jgi:hypothetical protein